MHLYSSGLWVHLHRTFVPSGLSSLRHSYSEDRLGLHTHRSIAASCNAISRSQHSHTHHDCLASAGICCTSMSMVLLTSAGICTHIPNTPFCSWHAPHSQSHCPLVAIPGSCIYKICLSLVPAGTCIHITIVAPPHLCMHMHSHTHCPQRPLHAPTHTCPLQFSVLPVDTSNHMHSD